MITGVNLKMVADAMDRHMCAVGDTAAGIGFVESDGDVDELDMEVDCDDYTDESECTFDEETSLLDDAIYRDSRRWERYSRDRKLFKQGPLGSL